MEKKQKDALIEYMKKNGYTHDSAANKFAPKYNEMVKNQKDPLVDCIAVEKKNTRNGVVDIPYIIKMPRKQRDTLIIFLHEKGYSLKWIEQCIGVTYMTVVKVIYRWKEKNKV